MTNQASKSKTFKIIMSIMIPLLIVVTTVVMVGASFAWFTNADKVTVTANETSAMGVEVQCLDY